MKSSRDNTKVLIDSLIPLGMIFGGAIGVLFGMFFKPSVLVFTISIGSGIGYLFGTIAYAIIVKKEDHSL
ncbi:hypothetical protein [Bacillus sp. FJAT-50079]|uniref:hypothetical protein n=1 Tax=Bacillus sp. FJAT-50079 TaxID=2833577 RepID=UPI0020165B86|nr:hypothetical protein [Bacillus sp. FJAT-50079]